jgi:biotin carboxylase
MADRPIAVVYDAGAASAGEIALGLAGLGPVAFLVRPSGHTDRVAGVLAELGTVLPLTGRLADDAAAVARLAPAAVLTFSEAALRPAAELAGALGLPGHDPATVLLLTDKARQRERLRAAGVEDVRSQLLDSPAGWPGAIVDIGLPAVVKPVYGQGSRDTHLVRTEPDGRRLLADLFAAGPGAAGGLLVEQALVGRAGPPGVGDYVSVESLSGPGGVSHLAVTGKLPLLPPFREVGQFWPAELAPGEEAAVLDRTGRALAALGVTVGFTHTELKLTPAGPRIIEVNGRLGGHLNELARRACGVDLIRLAGLAALGEPVTAAPLRPARVYFQHYDLAPCRPCRLVGIHGDRQLRRLPGITGYRAYARVGDQLPGGVMTRPLDLLTGDCDRPDQLAGLLAPALDMLAFELDFGAGPRRVSAAALERDGHDPERIR